MIDEKKLIKQCKRGVAKAQRELYDRYRTKWFMISLRYTKNRDDALDVLQNALINIFGKLDQFKPESGSFSAWSSRILVNESIMFIRKQSRDFLRTELDDDLMTIDARENQIERMSAEELTNLISKLPDGYRLVFNLYVIEGYTHKEIARMLGISEGTSKSQLYKAKKMLRNQIEVIL
jgi:RNA polymerase sigma-70 factor (ECF subfamily)